MAEQTPKYGLVLIMFAAACVLTYAVRLQPVRALQNADLKSLPMKIGDWRGEDWALDPKIEKSLGADDVISRSYNDGLPDNVVLFVIYRKYGRREFVHRPEACYPAAGYEITSKGYTTVPYAGRQITAYKVVAQKNEFDKQVIVYWFVSGKRTEASFVKQQIWMALDRIRPRKYGWAFVRIACPVIYSEEDALGRIREFLSKASAHLEKTLTGARRG